MTRLSTRDSTQRTIFGCAMNSFSCAVIWSLVTYILADFLLYHRRDSPILDSDASPPNEQLGILEGLQDSAAKCNTRDGFYEDDTSSPEFPHDPWSQTKWVLKPAACRVRGQLIEKLDDLNNFRRGFSLRFADNVEDRTHILPWLLGTKIDLNRRGRRVYLDLGANSFTSSIQWFLQMYPVDFTEVHAFEILPSLLQQSTLPEAAVEETNWELPNRHSLRTKHQPGFPAWMLDRIRIYNHFVSDEDDSQTRAVNITRFIKEDLKLTQFDTVIVKMDIENSEWKILVRWMQDPEMIGIIDEIFVEVHYKHTSMYDFHWKKFDHSREQVKRLLADLRWKGLYVHFWP